jgi:hypothetical protein
MLSMLTTWHLMMMNGIALEHLENCGNGAMAAAFTKLEFGVTGLREDKATKSSVLISVHEGSIFIRREPEGKLMYTQ